MIDIKIENKIENKIKIRFRKIHFYLISSRSKIRLKIKYVSKSFANFPFKLMISIQNCKYLGMTTSYSNEDLQSTIKIKVILAKAISISKTPTLNLRLKNYPSK